MVRAADRRRERGYALLTALFVLFLLAVALELAASALLLRLRASRADAERTVLTALSDAALAEAVALPWSGSETVASFNVRLPQDGDPAGRLWAVRGRFEVRAAAGFAGRLRVVRAEVARNGGSAWVVSWARAQPFGDELD